MPRARDYAPRSGLVAGGPGRGGRVSWQPSMNERDLEGEVRRIMRDVQRFGGRLLTYHTHDSRRSAEGFPDWVIAGPGGLVFAELKTRTGKPSPAQQGWLAMLQWLGHDAVIWRPADLESGRIAQTLARIGGLKQTGR